MICPICNNRLAVFHHDEAVYYNCSCQGETIYSCHLSYIDDELREIHINKIINPRSALSAWWNANLNDRWGVAARSRVGDQTTNRRLLDGHDPMTLEQLYDKLLKCLNLVIFI